MTFRVVKIFDYKDRTCVIVKKTVAIPTNLFNDWHNGYLEVKGKEKERDYGCQGGYDIAEITFQGELDQFEADKDKLGGKHFIGFDSAHYWNDKEPVSKTAYAVELRLKILAWELEDYFDKRTNKGTFKEYFDEKYRKCESL